MKKRLVIFSIFFSAAIACLALLFVAYKTDRAAYESKYGEGNLLGRSKAEVVEILGKPEVDTENSDIWVYQEGMDPDAFIDFKSDKVDKVTLLQKDHTKELLMFSVLSIVAILVSGVICLSEKKHLTSESI